MTTKPLQPDTFVLRPLAPSDQDILWELTYHAIWVPPSEPLPPRHIVQRAEIAQYVRGWGRAGDIGIAAEESGTVVGAAWARLLKAPPHGYGFVDNETPELTIALLPAYRGLGLGTRLLTTLLEAMRPHYNSLSLSVAPKNPARRLYQRLGFDTIAKSPSAWTMVKRW